MTKVPKEIKKQLKEIKETLSYLDEMGIDIFRHQKLKQVYDQLKCAQRMAADYSSSKQADLVAIISRCHGELNFFC